MPMTMNSKQLWGYSEINSARHNRSDADMSIVARRFTGA